MRSMSASYGERASCLHTADAFARKRVEVSSCSQFITIRPLRNSSGGSRNGSPHNFALPAHDLTSHSSLFVNCHWLHPGRYNYCPTHTLTASRWSGSRYDHTHIRCFRLSRTRCWWPSQPPSTISIGGGCNYVRTDPVTLQARPYSRRPPATPSPFWVTRATTHQPADRQMQSFQCRTTILYSLNA